MNAVEKSRFCPEGRHDKGGKSIIISAPAKINLFLKITGKRSDGFHDIYSWFQVLDLADQLRITLREDEEIRIETDCRDLPKGQDNLVYQAASLIREAVGQPIGFNVEISKNIPIAAGLGGGSSDAAAFIKAANSILDLRLSRRDMEDMGAEIGSDVPFFFSGGQAAVSGRGEKVKDIHLATDYEVALITPPFPIRAAEAYQKVRLDLTDPFLKISLSCCQKVINLFSVISETANDLERALLDSYPVLGRIKEELAKTGADIVRLSGSGPTVFALYRHKGLKKAKLAKSFERAGWAFRLAQPVTLPAND